MTDRVEYEFRVTEREIEAFIDQVIGRCFSTEVPQHLEVYDALPPAIHSGFMDISLYCECQPEFRFIVAFTQNFAAQDYPAIERGDWKLLVFDRPDDAIARLLYAMVRTNVMEGSRFMATSWDIPDRDSWIAQAVLSE